MARYMCGTLDIGETRFNDVPFAPSQDCVHWEFCQEDAYKQGRKDQGELNADTIREIHELVYQQGIEKGRAEAIEKIKDSIHEIYKNQFYCMEDLCEHSKPTADMCVDCFYESVVRTLEQLKERIVKRII